MSPIRRGYRTLMIDIDAQGSLTTLFGLRPDADVDMEHTLAPWFYGPGRNEWTGSRAIAIQPTYWHGLDLIAGNLQLYGAEFALAGRQAKEPTFRFYRVLADGSATVSKGYDVIVIDTPPSLSFLTTNAIYTANGIVMPVPPAMMDFASSVSFFQLLSELVPPRVLVRKDCVDPDGSMAALLDYFDRHTRQELIGQTAAINTALIPLLLEATGVPSQGQRHRTPRRCAQKRRTCWRVICLLMNHLF